LLASMPLAVYGAYAGGIVGDDTSDIGNTSQGTDPVESIAINGTNFPDDTFRNYVDTNFDTTDDDDCKFVNHIGQ